MARRAITRGADSKDGGPLELRLSVQSAGHRARRRAAEWRSPVVSRMQNRIHTPGEVHRNQAR